MIRLGMTGSLALLFVVASAVGLVFVAASCSGVGEERAVDGGDAVADEWTCSMHPQVRQAAPGDCPLCGMDLIPVEDGVPDDDDREGVLAISEAGLKLMELETAQVRRMAVSVDVDLVGRVAADESRVSLITAWVPGRIERLHVDYVGAEVTSGQPLVDIYSPDLVAAQEELIQSSRAYRAAIESESGRAGETTLSVLKAARRRLSLWGLTDEQVSEIEDRGYPETNVTILAAIGGTVVEKNVSEGTYVQTGRAMFTVADLSRVWIELAAHESDLAWLSEGARVRFSVEGSPGVEFTGSLSFVAPVLDQSTRTVEARVEVDNPGGLLKPDMFVRAVVEAMTGDTGGRAPLVIPATAPLITGRRAVVYVAVEDATRPTFEGREIVLGPRAGDYYVVESGLVEGEHVVVEGAFKIDSALQIRAEPSMMSPDDGDGGAGGSQGMQPGHRH